MEDADGGYRWRILARGNSNNWIKRNNLRIE
jgi:hypothetical protein